MESDFKQMLVEFKSKKATLDKEMKEFGSSKIGPMFAEAFAKTDPRIQAISWTQYTPYFNDGDSCTFSAHTSYPSYIGIGENGETLEDDENYGHEALFASILGPEPPYAYHGHDSKEAVEVYNAWEKKKSALTEPLREILGLLTDDILEMAFGDHVKVTVHRDGTIETESYDHD